MEVKYLSGEKEVIESDIPLINVELGWSSCTDCQRRQSLSAFRGRCHVLTQDGDIYVFDYLKPPEMFK